MSMHAVTTLREASTVPATLATLEMESTVQVCQTLPLYRYTFIIILFLLQTLMSVHLELTTVMLLLNVLTLLGASTVPATLALREMESAAQVIHIGNIYKFGVITKLFLALQILMSVSWVLTTAARMPVALTLMVALRAPVILASLETESTALVRPTQTYFSLL